MTHGYIGQYRYQCSEHPAPSGASMLLTGAWRDSRAEAEADREWHGKMHKCRSLTAEIVTPH